MNKKARKIIAASGIGAATAAVAGVSSYITTRYLMRVALDREEPKTIKKAEKLIAGSKISNDFLDRIEASAEKLSAEETETVEIVSHDGTLLSGHWLPCENAERVVIAMHGWRSSWYKDFGMIADFWKDSGCSVLYAEQRGQNNSAGDYMGFGLIERYDCLDWVQWVNERCGSRIPVYLGGVSMGATTVLMAAGLELPDNVHGIVADCGFTSPDAIWKHVAENNLHLSYGIHKSMANSLCKKKIQFGAKDYSTVDAVRNTSIPILFIHGTDDNFVPVEMSYENYVNCASPKRLYIVPGADHGMSYFVDKAGYEAVVKDFWKQFDGCSWKDYEEKR